jgi:hypothetical protein
MTLRVELKLAILMVLHKRQPGDFYRLGYLYVDSLDISRPRTPGLPDATIAGKNRF